MRYIKDMKSPVRYDALILGFIVVMLCWVRPANLHADIALTRHNLSAWSLYATNVRPFSAVDVRRNRVCIYCHTPHNADSTQAPLWGHMSSSVAVYNVISTVTIGKTQPNGISKKCLSCHDGTVAIGALVNGNQILMTGNDVLSEKMAPTAAGYLGTDLVNNHYHHPVSYNYSTAAYQKNLLDPGEMVLPLSAYNKKHMLDRLGRVQCHSCHNPHNDGGNSQLLILVGVDAAPGDPLWRKELDCDCGNSTVCGSCHTSARDDVCVASEGDIVYEGEWQSPAYCP